MRETEKRKIKKEQEIAGEKPNSSISLLPRASSRKQCIVEFASNKIM